MQEISIERNRSDRPHAGKVFAAVHAHVSDVPYFASGLCAKLMAEGFIGYLIRTTNDETSGVKSTAQNILSNETEHAAMAKALGFKDVFELYYRSHRMNEISPVELRGRLVLLFRFLKADTVLSYRHPPKASRIRTAGSPGARSKKRAGPQARKMTFTSTRRPAF